MKARYVKIGVVLLFAACLIQFQPVLANSPQYFTYTYDFWGIERESPDAYSVETVLIGADIGIDNFKDPQGLYVRNDKVFVADSGNNRIVELDSNLKFVRIIDSFKLNGEESYLNYPSDVFVTENGEIYISDTNNYRVVHLDNNLNVIKIITKPSDALMDEISEFLPTKLVVDNAERVYLLARNVNKGIMEFDSRGSFTGYVGANKVSYNIADQIWKSYFSTKAQKEQMVLFVPTEYNNIALDKRGFFYTTCDTVSESDIYAMFEADDALASMLFGLNKKSNVDPVRRLNSMGADILIKNGWYPPIGDIVWGDAGGISGISKFIDVAANEYDTYFALDRTRGRIFAYDFQGNMLFAFGGTGNKAGFFQYPTAIDIVGDSILVLDGRSGGITKFNPTEYGTLIHKALFEYVKGNYEESADLWENVLMYNSNYELAYIGIGRSFLRQDRYKEAMEYFKLTYSRKNYSKAFQQYRKQVVEENITLIIGGVVGLYLIFKIAKLLKRRSMNRNKGGAQNGIKKLA